MYDVVVREKPHLNELHDSSSIPTIPGRRTSVCSNVRSRKFIRRLRHQERVEQSTRMVEEVAHEDRGRRR